MLLSRALLFLQTLFESILIGMIIAETSISLCTIEKDAQCPTIVLVFGVQVTDLCTLGGFVEGMQGGEFVIQDVQGKVHARLGQDGWGKGNERNEGVGELHLKAVISGNNGVGGEMKGYKFVGRRDLEICMYTLGKASLRGERHTRALRSTFHPHTTTRLD